MNDRKSKLSQLSTIAFLIINALFLWGTWEIGKTLDRVEQRLVSIDTQIHEYTSPQGGNLLILPTGLDALNKSEKKP